MNGDEVHGLFLLHVEYQIQHYQLELYPFLFVGKAFDQSSLHLLGFWWILIPVNVYGQG